MFKERVLVLRGISGSGKSTFARKLLPYGWYLVSRDAIRLDILGEDGLKRYFTQGGMDYNFEEYISKIEDRQLAGHLIKKHKVVIDDTNLRKKYFQNLVNIFAETDTSPREVRIIDFAVPLEIAIERCKARENKPVEEEVIRRQYNYAKNPFPIEDFLDKDGHWITKGELRKWYIPDFDTMHYMPDYSLPRAVIVDIDGTTAHRSVLTTPTVHLRGFYEYGEVETDEPDEFLQQIIHGLQAIGTTIIFVSGRKREDKGVDVENLTKNFIRKHYNISNPILFMRDPVLDKDSLGRDLRDDAVKNRIFWEEISSQYCVIGAFDDRARVCALWEDIGVKCLNCTDINEIGTY